MTSSGYAIILGEAIVSGKSTIPTCIAKSTVEFEPVALEKTATEVEWLENLLCDLPL